MSRFTITVMAFGPVWVAMVASQGVVTHSEVSAQEAARAAAARAAGGRPHSVRALCLGHVYQAHVLEHPTASHRAEVGQALQPGWIRATDAKPDADETVLAVNSMAETYWIATWDGAKWIDVDSEQERRVTHWRHLDGALAIPDVISATEGVR